MAVRPENVINFVCQEDNAVFCVLETLIDKELTRWQKEVQGNEPVLIKIGTNITAGVKEIVVKRYQEQGWTVEIIQARGGECFKFTRNKNLKASLEDVAAAVADRIETIKARTKTFFKFWKDLWTRLNKRNILLTQF